MHTSFDGDIETVRAMMDDDSSETQMERRCDSIIRELDELVAFAANKETVDLVEANRIAIGQIITRAQLIGAFLMARKPNLTVVRNARTS